MISPASETGRHAIGRAIVADDDDFFRLALTSILKTRFALDIVEETASFDEAIERLNHRHLGASGTLAIFDLSMPGMAGASSLAAVREAHPDVIVTVVSASSRRRDILDALAVGAHGYIPKRLGAQELGRAFSYVLSGEIYVPASLADIEPHRCTSDPSKIEADGTRQMRGEQVSLTPRQTEVLSLIVDGKSNKEVARTLKLSEGTVKIHVASLLRVLGVENRAAAAAVGSRLSATRRDVMSPVRRDL